MNDAATIAERRFAMTMLPTAARDALIEAGIASGRVHDARRRLMHHKLLRLGRTEEAKRWA